MLLPVNHCSGAEGGWSSVARHLRDHDQDSAGARVKDVGREVGLRSGDLVGAMVEGLERSGWV